MLLYIMFIRLSYVSVKRFQSSLQQISEDCMDTFKICSRAYVTYLEIGNQF